MMRIRGKLTSDEAYRVRSLFRSRYWYWWNAIAGYMLPVGLIVTALICTIQSFSSHKWGLWIVLAGLWFAGISFLVAVIFSKRRQESKELAKFIGSLPDYFLLQPEGVSAHFNNGLDVTGPWSFFKSWREAESFIVLKPVDGTGPVLLPLGDLDVSEQEALRVLLRSNLGDMAERPILEVG